MKNTPKARVLEHLGVLRQYAKDLNELIDAYENHAHHKKVTWGHAGDLANFRKELEELFYNEEDGSHKVPS